MVKDMTKNSTHSLPCGTSSLGHSGDAPPAATKRPDVAFLDAQRVLKRLIEERRDRPAREVVNAVCSRGVALGYPPRLVRRVLLAADRSRYAFAVRSDAAFKPLWRAARANDRALSSPAGRAEEARRLARRLVGTLLSSAPDLARREGEPDAVLDAVTGQMVPAPPRRLSASAEARARQAMVVVGLALIDSIHDEQRGTVMVSAGWLGVQTGVGRLAAAKTLRDCLAVGWLRRLDSRPGNAGRYDLGAKNRAWRPEVLAAADVHSLAVAALVARAPEVNPLAEVIAIAGHPGVAWSHDPADRTDIGMLRPWLTAIATEARIDATVLGLSPRKAKEHQRAWLAVLSAHGAVREDLDAHARNTGAVQRAREAEDARRVRATERAAAIGRNRRAGIGMHALLADDPVPAPDAERAVLDAWLVGLHQAAAASGMPADLAPHLAERLAAQMRAAGHPAAAAKKAAAWVAGLDSAEDAA